MNSVDFSVLQTASNWLKQGVDAQQVWLATVVKTFGSSPRPIGATLALRADGVLVGSVSGGCIEDDLVDKARSGALSADTAKVITYGVTTEEARQFGLPCGGSLTIVLEPLHDASWIEHILSLISQHRLVSRTLNLSTLSTTVADATAEDELSFDGNSLTTVYGPRWRLLIIGAGQTSQYLAKMAQALDYEVIICEPRIEFREVWDIPHTSLISDMPDDAVLSQQVDARTAVIALTHDPKLDDMALLEALKSPAFYVGALGSLNNNIKRRERLALFDLSADEINRLHGPVGLDIRSRTPPEIAVSVLAHIIAVKNQPPVFSRVTVTTSEQQTLACST